MNTKTEITNSAKNRVFLNNLAALCSRRNVDMKEAFKAAGLNSDYIEDYSIWRNGSIPKSV